MVEYASEEEFKNSSIRHNNYNNLVTMNERDYYKLRVNKQQYYKDIKLISFYFGVIFGISISFIIFLIAIF